MKMGRRMFTQVTQIGALRAMVAELPVWARRIRILYPGYMDLPISIFGWRRDGFKFCFVGYAVQTQVCALLDAHFGMDLTNCIWTEYVPVEAPDFVRVAEQAGFEQVEVKVRAAATDLCNGSQLIVDLHLRA